MTSPKRRAPAADESSLHGPRLLPLLDRLEPSYVGVELPGTTALVVDGLRMHLKSNGSFELADGVLPLARQTQVVHLPGRLGGKVLFALGAPEDCWLLVADSFLAALSPLGRIDVPVTAVTPGFDAIYATIASTGLVIAIDPTNGRATESTLLPPAPEYGPIAVVDDWFGAYVDPLRGLMTSGDAGLHWHPVAKASIGAQGIGSRENPLADMGVTIVGLHEREGELVVELSQQSQVLLSRRGDARRVPALDQSGPASRSVRSWVQRWKLDGLGGWPIELAITRGALLAGGVAAVLSRGLLAEVRLRDGAIESEREVDVSPDRTCEALQAESEVFFFCQGVAATSVLRWVSSGQLERLAELVGQREVESVSAAGVLVRGACAARDSKSVGAYCALRPGRAPESIRLAQATGRQRLAILDATRVLVLTPPNGQRVASISYLGATNSEVPLVLPDDCSERQRRVLTEGFWLQRPTLARGTLSTWVTLGDDIMGVRIAPSGEVDLGEIVSGASRALFGEQRILVPDSSGYALESLDGGMTYLRPALPIPVANTLGEIAKRSQRYGCSRVGCRLGDWLRLGWSKSQHTTKNVSLELVTAPELVRLERPVRRMPRLRCDVEQVPVSPPRNPRDAPRESTTRGRSAVTESLGSTTFSPFYSTAAPRLLTSSLGFDRGQSDERVALRGYAQAPRLGGKNERWRLDFRFFDPLRRESPWSVTGQDIAFDSVEAVARAFAHPRYGAHVTSWSVVLDPDGDGALLTIDDLGHQRAFMLEPGVALVELGDLDGRAPRRITDIARLLDGWYLLGTEPAPRLVAFSAGRTRVVSELDPRAHLHAARLRMVKNRDRTRVAYLALSARLRARDVQWLVYPINVTTGAIEEPIVIPLDRGIRACDPNEDGWLFETSMDLVADVAFSSGAQDVSGRAQGLLLLTETGVCIDRMLINGMAPRPGKAWASSRRVRSEIAGHHVDEEGRIRKASCEIVETGAR